MAQIARVISACIALGGEASVAAKGGMAGMKIGLVIFDCDGVLVDSEVIYIEAELAFLARAGLSIDRDAYMQDFMGLAPESWRQKLEVLALEQTRRPLSQALLCDMEASTKAAMQAALTALPGAHRQISAIGLPCCVASSSGLAQLTWKLQHTGLLNLFSPHIFSAEMVERGKPSPDLFLHAATSVGVDPAACIVIEDSVNGIRAGKAAGMHVIGLTAGSHCAIGHDHILEAHGADRVIDHFDHLAPAITDIIEAKK